MSKNNFMVDLETMGTRPYSVITSIGVVAFDILTGARGAEFCMNIDQKTCIDVGLKIDPKTVEWWSKQDVKVYRRMFIDVRPLKDVLTALSVWLKHYETGPKFMWGNSASFDLGLLSQAYEVCNLTVPWAFWNERCCRTIVALNPNIKEAMGSPVGAHHPITDCKHQIQYVVNTIKSIQSVTTVPDVRIKSPN